MSNKELWYESFNSLKKYIDDNNKTPSSCNVDVTIKKLGRWKDSQIHNFKTRLQIMNDDEIYNHWLEFISSEKYSKYFMSNKEFWYYMFNELKIYIDKHNKRPSETSIDNNVKKLNKMIPQNNHYQKYLTLRYHNSEN